LAPPDRQEPGARIRPIGSRDDSDREAGLRLPTAEGIDPAIIIDIVS